MALIKSESSVFEVASFVKLNHAGDGHTNPIRLNEDVKLVVSGPISRSNPRCFHEPIL